LHHDGETVFPIDISVHKKIDENLTQRRKDAKKTALYSKGELAAILLCAFA
jgi:hypothetical protein